MAEDTNLEIEDLSKSKSKLIIIIAAVLLIVVAIGGYFFLSGSDSADTAADTDMISDTVSSAKSGSATIGSALYVSMPRAFVFNVPGASRDRVVQIKVQLLVRGEDNEEIAKKHIPLIEGTLLNIFSMTTADELSTSAGKEALRYKALDKVQAAMVEVEESTVIERVLFTGFVMQ